MLIVCEAFHLNPFFQVRANQFSTFPSPVFNCRPWKFLSTMNPNCSIQFLISHHIQHTHYIYSVALQVVLAAGDCLVNLSLYGLMKKVGNYITFWKCMLSLMCVSKKLISDIKRRIILV